MKWKQRNELIALHWRLFGSLVLMMIRHAFVHGQHFSRLGEGFTAQHCTVQYWGWGPEFQHDFLNPARSLGSCHDLGGLISRFSGEKRCSQPSSSSRSSLELDWRNELQLRREEGNPGRLDLRLPQPMSSDALTASAQRDYVFVVNPSGANGRTGQQWKRMLPDLNSRLGKDCNIREALTMGPLHAIEIAREAVRDGAAAVVAVGGDGTLHEVLNGFFENGKLVQTWDGRPAPRTALGLIPMGTGSDLARHFGWKLNDSHQAIDRLVKDHRRRIDVGRVQLFDDKVDRCFLNVASLHLSAKAGHFASMHKKLGNLCYIIGALQAFRSHEDRDLRMKIDGGEWKLVPKVTATCVGNAKYFGGGMKITPTADPFNGKLEVVSLMEYKWYDFILKMHTLYQGTHVHLDKVNTTSVQTLEVEDSKNKSRREGVFVQADGEHLGFLPAKFSIFPEQLDFIV